MHFSITNRFDLTIGVSKPRSLVVLNSTLSIIKVDVHQEMTSQKNNLTRLTARIQLKEFFSLNLIC